MSWREFSLDRSPAGLAKDEAPYRPLKPCSVRGCSEPAVNDRSMCPKHLEQGRLASSVRRAILRADLPADVCRSCFKRPVVDGRASCQSCLASKRDFARRHRARLSAAGRCYQCGDTLPERDTSKKCWRCRNSAALRARQRVINRRYEQE